MTEKYLEGQVAIVTGGMRGIGLGIAKRLHERGAKIAIWDRETPTWDEAAKGFTPEVVIKTDVSDVLSVERAFSDTMDGLGRVDILVNNAGINGPVLSTWDYPVEDWEKVIAIDLNGVFFCTRSVLAHMRARKSGRIINVASIAGKEGVPGISAYSAAKGGVIAFTKALAKELALDGVLVNCIAPALVETDLFSEMTPEHIAAMRAKIPMGRLLQIEEVASMVSWIAGPECTFTTGFAFDLTGGRATY
ncbi:MAG TPA: glucose 1-dehydrogenase [Aestuariivirga sp.]|nr:glucose 1-dehydrogenase [Aestuariivirga sp.]